LAKVEPKEAEIRSVEHRPELPRGGRSTSKKVVGRDALAGDLRRLRGEATAAFQEKLRAVTSWKSSMD